MTLFRLDYLVYSLGNHKITPTLRLALEEAMQQTPRNSIALLFFSLKETPYDKILQVQLVSHRKVRTYIRSE